MALRSVSGEVCNADKKSVFSSISPMGLVPAIHHEGETLYESGAIAIYLTEKINSKKSLAPLVGSPYRAEFLKWVIYATATLDPLLIKVFNTKGMSDDEREKHLKQIYSEFKNSAAHLESILEKSPFVVGGQFSAADIMLAQPLNWAFKAGLLEPHPVLMGYLQSLKQRKACIDSGIFNS